MQMIWDLLIKAYQDQLTSKGIAATTVRTYTLAANQLAEHFARTAPGELDAELVRSYFVHKESLAPTGHQKLVSRTLAFIDFLAEYSYPDLHTIRGRLRPTAHAAWAQSAIASVQPCWRDHLTGYLASLDGSSLAPNTRSKYFTSATQLARHVGPTPPADVTEIDILTFLGHAGAATPAEVTNHRHRLSRFFEWLTTTGVIKVNIVRTARAPGEAPLRAPKLNRALPVYWQLLLDHYADHLAARELAAPARQQALWAAQDVAEHFRTTRPRQLPTTALQTWLTFKRESSPATHALLQRDGRLFFAFLSERRGGDSRSSAQRLGSDEELVPDGVADVPEEWRQLLLSFEVALQQGGTPLKAVRRHLGRVRSAASDFGVLRPEDIDVEAAVQHLLRWRRQHPSTYEDHRRTLARCFEHAAQTGATAVNPFREAGQRLLEHQQAGARRREADDVTVAWRQAIDLYRAHLAERGIASATRTEYCKAVRGLARRRSDASPWRLTLADLTEHFELINNGEGSPSGRIKCASIARFYDWAAECGYVTVNLARLLLDERSRRLKPRTVSSEWQVAIDHFMRWLEAGGRAAGTRKLREAHLRCFAEHVAPRGPAEVLERDLLAWIGEEGIAQDTRRGRRATLSTFFKRMEHAGVVGQDPARYLPSIKVPRARPRPAPDSLIREALSTLPYRERLMVLIGALGGLRAMEIASLHTANVDFERAEMVVTGKGNVTRVVPLHPELERELRLWMSEHPGYLFTGKCNGHLSPKRVSTLLSRGLAGGWTGHTLRHRFASVGYEATRDLRAMQELLGHSSPAHTARYTAITQAYLRETVAEVGLRDSIVQIPQPAVSAGDVAAALVLA